jgi:putative MATE family efflux protein
MMKTKSKSDFTEGPLFARMILYTIPIMLSGLLQMFYNMADHMVLGKFSGDASALAAVGSTGALTSLIVGIMMGMSAGTAVVVAQFLGAKQNERVSSAVHTSMLFSVIDGIFFMALSFVVCGPILKLMGTKPDIIDEAILYLKIISCGFPAVAVLNFGAGILRSAGDSRTPLVILSLSGLVNVGLNLFFVTVLKMTVEGVALATIISQYVSATAIVTVLKTRQDEPYALCFKKLRIEMRMLMKIMRFGIGVKKYIVAFVYTKLSFKY